MATPKDRANEPARKLVMDKSKLMPALDTPEEETVRNYRKSQGKAKLESIREMATAPRSSVDISDPSFDRAHKGKRQGPRLPAEMPAAPKPEIIKPEKPLKKSAAVSKPAFSSDAARRAWYINNGITPRD
jgi:hypothetical protein